MSTKFETTFRTAIATAERDVLVGQLRENPQMTLHELGKLATGELSGLLKQLTVGDLVGNAFQTPHASSAAAPAPAPARKKAGRPRGSKNAQKPAAAAATPTPTKRAAKPAKTASAAIETRTPEGRDAYDAAVLAALRAASGPQAASDLTSVAGGSALQIRTALARLIEAGSVHWSGRARGTRYSPA